MINTSFAARQPHPYCMTLWIACHLSQLKFITSYKLGVGIGDLTNRCKVVLQQ